MSKTFLIAGSIVDTDADRETFENTIIANQPLDRTAKITINIGTFMVGTAVSPNNIAEFEMSSSLTPTAGGDPITETYELNNVQFYGHVTGITKNWWHIVDGKWSDSVGYLFADTIILDNVGNRNAQVKTNKQYPQSTGTATYKLAFKFGEDFSAKFPFYVVQKDLGYFEK